MLAFCARVTPMLRFTALIGISVATLSVAVAEDAKPDTVEVRGKPLVLSCAEWKRSQDGSWTSTGPMLVGGDGKQRDLARGEGNQRLGGEMRRGIHSGRRPIAKQGWDPTCEA